MTQTISLAGPHLSLRARLTGGIIWHVISAVFTQGSGFPVNIIMADRLGRDLFGEFGMINFTLLNLFGIAPGDNRCDGDEIRCGIPFHGYEQGVIRDFPTSQ